MSEDVKSLYQVDKKLKGLARAMANHLGLEIEFGGAPCTNGMKMTLPLLPSNVSLETFNLYIGFVDHEAAHVKYSNFMRGESLERIIQHFRDHQHIEVPHSFASFVENVVEDVLVEAMMCDALPGADYYFNAMITIVGKKYMEPKDPEQERFERLYGTIPDSSDHIRNGLLVGYALALDNRRELLQNDPYIRKILSESVARKAFSACIPILTKIARDKNSRDTMSATREIITRVFDNLSQNNPANQQKQQQAGGILILTDDDNGGSPSKPSTQGKPDMIIDLRTGKKPKAKDKEEKEEKASSDESSEGEPEDGPADEGSKDQPDDDATESPKGQSMSKDDIMNTINNIFDESIGKKAEQMLQDEVVSGVLELDQQFFQGPGTIFADGRCGPKTYNDARHMSSGFKKIFINTFLSFKQKLRRTHQTSGVVDMKRASKVLEHGFINVFKLEKKFRRVNTALHLAVDCSSSMSCGGWSRSHRSEKTPSPIIQVRNISVAMSDALQATNVSLSISLYNNNVRLLKGDLERMSLDKAKKITANGGTDLAKAMLTAGNYMLGLHKERNIMLALTDGSVNKDTVAIDKLLRAHGIECYYIIIGASNTNVPMDKSRCVFLDGDFSDKFFKGLYTVLTEGKINHVEE